MFVDGTMLYDGATKQTIFSKQNQLEFKDGLLIKESSAEIIGTLKFGSQKVYTYNSNNELININDASGIADVGGSADDIKITYIKNGETIYVYKNSNSYLNKYFDKNGNLIGEDTYDYQSKYISEKVTFKNGVKTTITYNSKQEPKVKTTEYFNKGNQPILKVYTDYRFAKTDKVTTYTYDANGNLTECQISDYKNDMPGKNVEYFKDGKITPVPDNFKIGKTITIPYYNYSEGTLWTVQIAGNQKNKEEIEVKMRAIKTSDGKMYNTNNQGALMTFLADTYTKINASKP